MGNILIFIPTLKSGGAEKQASILASRLSFKHHVEIVIKSSEDTIDEKNSLLLNAGGLVKIHSLKGNSFVVLKQLYNILKKSKIDIVFNFLTYPDFWGSVVAKLAGVKKIYNGIRSSRLPFHKYILEYIVHNFLVTATIFNSYSGAKYFERKGFRKSKIKIIRNCLSFRIEKKDVIRNEDITIVSVGRFSPEKDYKTALHAIKILSDTDLRFVYKIIGYGSLEDEIRSCVIDLGIENYVEIVLNPPNVMDLVLHSDLYLSTSLYEGTSNSIMEAMGAGLPIVATLVGDNDYMVQNGYNGFLHSVRDYGKIADSLRLLILDSEKRLIYGKRSKELLEDRFSVLRFERDYMKLTE